MAEYRLSCPLCAAVSALPLAGTAVRYECSVCHCKFELDPNAARAALDLIDKGAVTKQQRDGISHCEKCGSLLWRAEAVARDG